MERDDFTTMVNSVGGGDNFGISSNFFIPNNKFIDWLIEYANDRLILDVGSGTGLLLKLIQARGYNKLFGIEPHFDVMKYRQMCMLNHEEAIHFEQSEVQNSTMFKALLRDSQHAKPALVVFARPCHSRFVEEGIDLMPSGTEALYITIPENLDKYDDLGEYYPVAKKLNHEGASKEGEWVYSIIKP